MEKSIDPLTGETFMRTRSNQVFASRLNQIKFNNFKAQKKRKSKEKINKILDKNYNVLASIVNGKKSTVKSYDFLLGAGFNFSCVTHHVKHEQKKWNCVYDYAYLVIGDKQFKIIQLEN